MTVVSELVAKLSVDGVEESGRKLGGFSQTLENASSSARKAGAALSLGVTAPLVLFGKMAAGTASDVNESLSKVNVVFGDSAAAVTAFSETTTEAFGISEGAALEAAGTFGTIFSGVGIAQDAAADMSTTMLGLAGDLASFNNLETGDALEKLRSGLVGEAEPLRALGVVMSEAEVTAKAMGLGLADVAEELTAADKVQARYALILEKTTLAQGDAGRTIGEAAGQAKVQAAAMRDLAATVGTQLLPIKMKLMGVVSRLIAAFQNLSPGAQSIIVKVGMLAAAVGPLLAGLGMILPALGAVGAALGVLLSPIGLVVAAVVGLALAFATNFGGVRDTVMAVVGPVIDGLKSFAQYIGFAATEGDYLNDFLADLPVAVQPIALAIGKVVGGVSEAIQTFKDLRAGGATTFGALRGAAAEFLTIWLGMDKARAVGEQITGIWRQMQAAWAMLVDFFTPTIDRLKAAFGQMIESFEPIGGKLSELWAAAKPVLTFLAEVVGVVLVTAFNLLLEVVAAVMPSIGGIISAAIDVGIAVFETLKTTFESVVGIVKGLIDGDWTAVWENAGQLVEGFWAALSTIFESLKTVVTTVIADIGEAIENWVGNLAAQSPAVAGAVETMTAIWTDRLQPAIATVSSFVTDTLIPAFSKLASFWSETLLPALTMVWDFITTSVMPLFTALADLVSAVLGLAIQVLAGLWENVLLPALDKVWKFIDKNVMPILDAVGAVVKKTLTPVFDALAAVFKGPLSDGLGMATTALETMKGIFDGIATVVSSVIGWIEKLTEKLKILKLPTWLTGKQEPEGASPAGGSRQPLGPAMGGGLAMPGMSGGANYAAQGQTAGQQWAAAYAQAVQEHISGMGDAIAASLQPSVDYRYRRATVGVRALA